MELALAKRIDRGPNIVPSDTGVEVRRFSDDRGTEELQRHGEVYATITNEGRETRGVNKTSDLLRRLRRQNDITAPAFNAGRMFEEIFFAARMNPSVIVSMEPLGGGRRTHMAESTYQALERLHGAVVALGGHASQVSGVIWHCIGNGTSLKDWCLRSSSPNSPREAKGMLCAALVILAAYWHVGDNAPDGG